MEAKIEGNVEKIDVSQIIATCSLTATWDDRVEGSSRAAAPRQLFNIPPHFLPPPSSSTPVPNPRPSPISPCSFRRKRCARCENCFAQELLTINHSSRYPNLSVVPLLMQMTQRSPRALFGFSRSLLTALSVVLPPIQRVNGKSRLEKAILSILVANCCRAFTFYYHAYSRQTIAPPGLSSHVSSSPPGPRFATYRVSIVIGEGRIAIPKILLVPTGLEYLYPPSQREGDIALSQLPVTTTPINYESVNECSLSLSLLFIYRNIGLYKRQYGTG